MPSPFTHRIATLDDLEELRHVMALSIAHNQSAFLTTEQIAASEKVMGLDTQLIRDGTYFVIECGGQIAACGGWSFRGTLYGGDQSIVTREPERLDPATDAAKIRAMYTHPDFVRRGLGRRILDLCEAAARDAGFSRVELMGTAAGVRLYESHGYVAKEEPHFADVNGVSIPLLQMGKGII
jgi:GNAT superfamily N-acetyltransferase